MPTDLADMIYAYPTLLQLFEMCCIHMGIAQIALDPPPLFQTGKRGKKRHQTGQCPYGNNSFQKGASLIVIIVLLLLLLEIQIRSSCE